MSLVFSKINNQEKQQCLNSLVLHFQSTHYVLATDRLVACLLSKSEIEAVIKLRAFSLAGCICLQINSSDIFCLHFFQICDIFELLTSHNCKCGIPSILLCRRFRSVSAWNALPEEDIRATSDSVVFNNNNNNNNTNDNVYGAIIMTQSVREFTRFIWRTQTKFLV